MSSTGDRAYLRVVGALMERDGRVLITRRPEGSRHAGKWEFPGGKVRRGEGDKDALRREILEELGVEVKVGRHFHTVSFDYDDFGITLLIFRCDMVGGVPRCIEVAELAWVPVDELLSYTLTPADLPVAEKLVEERSHTAS